MKNWIIFGLFSIGSLAMASEQRPPRRVSCLSMETFGQLNYYIEVRRDEEDGQYTLSAYWMKRVGHQGHTENLDFSDKVFLEQPTESSLQFSTSNRAPQIRLTIDLTRLGWMHESFISEYSEYRGDALRNLAMTCKVRL